MQKATLTVEEVGFLDTVLVHNWSFGEVHFEGEVISINDTVEARLMAYLLTKYPHEPLEVVAQKFIESSTRLQMPVFHFESALIFALFVALSIGASYNGKPH